MSDVATAATIASLRAEVERLTAELQGERDDVAACRAEVNRLSKYAERLLAENVRFVNAATELRERNDSLSKSIITACTGSGCLNAHELRQALDRERERAGVLAKEVLAWRAITLHNTWTGVLPVGCMVETDRTHALDAAKFGKEQE